MVGLTVAEIRVFKCIPAEGISNEDLIAAAGKEMHKIGFSYCMKNKWVKKDKASGLIVPIVAEPKDELQAGDAGFSAAVERIDGEAGSLQRGGEAAGASSDGVADVGV